MRAIRKISYFPLWISLSNKMDTHFVSIEIFRLKQRDWLYSKKKKSAKDKNVILLWISFSSLYSDQNQYIYRMRVFTIHAYEFSLLIVA